MPIIIGSNISSMQAQRRLNESGAALSDTFSRLSTGQRINKASDDAAGLAISESLRTDRLVFKQGVRNLNDGLSLTNIADSSLEQLTSISMRLKELAAQSANGSLGTSQRKALDGEAQQLAKEYLRIAQTTKFNGISLFSASTGQLRFQGGYGTDGGIASGFGGAIGLGTFSSSVSYLGETTNSQSIAIADLNGDGIQDIVTAGRADGNIGYATVRLGNSDGTFGAITSYTTETFSSYSVKLGDLNNDGILDLVTSGTTGPDGYATVRIGVGNGTFGASRSYFTDTAVSLDVALGDINGDGKLDIVTGGQNDAATGSVTALIGRGDGTFNAGVSFVNETTATASVSLGDLNGDGLADLITAGRQVFDGYITVRLASSSGTFGAATSYTAETRMSNSIVLGDVNGDGFLDALSGGATDAAFDGYATIRLGRGDGTFGASTSYLSDLNTTNAVALGDVNGDGFLDLVTSGYDDAFTGTASVRLGRGDGTFDVVRSYATEGSGSWGLALGDTNGDGVLDIATAGFNGADGYMTILRGDTRDGVGALLPFTLTTQADSLQALSAFGNALTRLTNQRSTIGAFQSRLGVAVSTLGSAGDSYANAEASIRDADVASDSAQALRLGILQQVATSVLAQANQQPALAVTLLSNI